MLNALYNLSAGEKRKNDICCSSKLQGHVSHYHELDLACQHFISYYCFWFMWLMTYFHSRYPPVHIVRKKASKVKKCAPRKLVLARSMFIISNKSEKRMLFWCLLRKMASIYPWTDELWRAENWPKLVSSLVYLLCVSRCYSSAVITFSGFPDNWRIYTSFISWSTVCSISLIYSIKTKAMRGINRKI